MNQPIGSKTRMLIIFICLAVLYTGPLMLLNAQPGDRPQKDEAFKRKKYLFFLTDNNLYDGRLLLKVKDKIGLNRKQVERIENLMLEHEAFSIRNTGEIKIKELQFAAYVKKGKTDRKEMERHIREISRIKTNLIVHYMNYLLDVRDLLTPRQLETLTQMKDRKKDAIRQREKQENKKRADSPTCPGW